MVVKVLTVKLYAPWVESLKEKRMILKGLKDKLQRELHVSVIESDAQNILKTIVISVCFISNSISISENLSQKVISFIEKNTDAEILDIFEENR